MFQPDVLVVSLNPSDDPDEEIPRLGGGLDTYVAFYADRFSDDRRVEDPRSQSKVPSCQRTTFPGQSSRPYVNDHYRDVEALLIRSLSPAHDEPPPLGTTAVYCDAVPWKWKTGALKGVQANGEWKRRKLRKADWALAAARVKRIVDALEPRLVLTLGAPGEHIFGRLAKDGPHAQSPSQFIDYWPSNLTHVASYHVAAHGHRFKNE